MTGKRRLLIDDSPGERRGVVLLDGAPERMLIERDGESPPLAAGRRAVGRIRRIERGLGLAFVDLGAEEGIAPLAKGMAEGLALEVEVAAPMRRGKLAKLVVIGPASGEPRPLGDSPPFEARLQALVPGATIERGALAVEAADLAEEAVLAVIHPMGDGASLSVEETRGMTALDIDLGGAGGGNKRASELRINRKALAVGARILRLKGLGGLVVFDLAGRGQDGPALLEAAKAAFSPDQPGVALGPISRLGVFHLAKPWRGAPVAEQLKDADGAPSPRTVAQRLARAIEAEARRAVRVDAVCAPDVAEAAVAIRPALLARLGPRFDIRADPTFGRDRFETRSL